MTNDLPNDGDARLARTGVRRLVPERIHIFRGAFALLHCRVEGDSQLYRGVWAVLLFPISHPDCYVSLRCTDHADKEQEIGVLERLADFPEDVQGMIRSTLRKQYHQQPITRIHQVVCRYGLLFFDVETEGGRREFTMPWRHDRTEEFGANGKVLLDSLDNRYIIPNVQELPAADRARFLGFIYW